MILRNRAIHIINNFPALLPPNGWFTLLTIAGSLYRLSNRFQISLNMLSRILILNYSFSVSINWTTLLGLKRIFS